MKFRLTALVLLSICLSNAFADEGMWLLGNLKKNKQTERVMKDLGLQMPVNKLYNRRNRVLRMLWLALEVFAREWWSRTTGWFLLTITVGSAVFSNTLRWSTII